MSLVAISSCDLLLLLVVTTCCYYLLLLADVIDGYYRLVLSSRFFSCATMRNESGCEIWLAAHCSCDNRGVGQRQSELLSLAPESATDH